MEKETPISKYLATLERRQALRERDLMYGSSPTPVTSPPGSQNVMNFRQQLRFDDETFIQPHDQTMMTSSPPMAFPTFKPLLPLPPAGPSRPATAALLPSAAPSSNNDSFDGAVVSSSGFKRKRYSFEDKDDEDNQIKKICELQKLLRQTNGELVEARAMTAKLERQKMDLRTESYEKSLQFEKSMTEMRNKCRDAVDKFDNLQNDNELKTQKLDELKDELRRYAGQHTEKMLALESKVSKLQCENTDLKQKHEEEKLNQSDSIKKMSTNLHDSEKDSEKWSLECQILKDQLALKETQLAKYMEELKEAQCRICRFTEMNQKFSETDSSEAQLLILKEQVKNYENLYLQEQNDNSKINQQLTKLKEENGYFRGSMNKEMLLEEKIASLESESRYLRTLLKSKTDIESERDSLKEQLNRWTVLAVNIDPEFTNTQKFKLFLGQTQGDLFEMKQENLTLGCKVDGLTRHLSRLQSEAAVAKQKEIQKKGECEKLETEMKQVSRRLMLVTKDRDGLKSLKESYEKELEGIISTALKDRVNQLENLVNEYEQGTTGISSGIANKCFECDKRMALIAELREELDKTKNYGHQDASNIGDFTMGGDGNTTGIKIVAFGNNPSSLSMESRVKELCVENEKLQNRIKYLEDQSMMGPGDTIIAQGNKIVEEQLRILERKHQILTEAYDYETQQLQTALSKLFGYHVILVREPQSQFRLQSVYGTSEDELIFQEAPNSDMMLLETPVLDNFRDDIDRFLLREGSIPGFLATVTIAFSSGQLQPSDASQLPSSQQSNAESEETITINPNQHDDSKTVEVQVEGESDNESEEDEDEAMEEEEEEEDEPEEDEEKEQYSDYDEEEDEEERRDVEFQQGGDDVVCIDSD